MVMARSRASTATARVAAIRASPSLSAIGEGVREAEGVGETVEVISMRAGVQVGACMCVHVHVLRVRVHVRVRVNT